MIIDNFEILKPFLTFENEGDFYFLELIKRKAENPEMPKSQRLIESFFIYNLDYLDEKKQEIIELCTENKARAYLRLNRRNDKKVALETLRLVAENVASEQYKVRNCYDSACGKFHSEPNKKWILDIDSKDFDDKEMLGVLETEIRPVDRGKKLYLKVPTPHGYHLITSPFDMGDFNKRGFKIDIHKDNPTILYCNFD